MKVKSEKQDLIHGAGRQRWLVFCFALMFLQAVFIMNAQAGKHSYAELSDEISYGVIEILIKYGVPASHDRGNKWYAISGRPGHYTILFSSSDEIPQQAVLDTIKFCMDLYQQQGLEEELVEIEIWMYKESEKERRDARILLFFGGVEPFFKLRIGEDE